MKAAIIGGGISGLTMALAFEKVGIDYTVYEKAVALNEIGAGIWVSTNAMLVFDWLGIANRIKEKGMALNRIAIVDDKFNVLQETNQEIFKQKLGFSGVAIHRALLQKTLFDAIPREKIKLDHAYQFIEYQTDAVETIFKNGLKVKTDFAIAADGIHSGIRKALFPESTTRDSGQICWRGIANMNLKKPYQDLSAECWGNEIRFGFSAIAHDQVYWFAVAKTKKVSEDLSKLEIRKLFSDFPTLVDQIIENTEEGAIICRTLHDLRPMHKWHSGNIMLVGDAAHATTPNMGQGAAQGIEDAYYLSQLLANHPSIAEAYRQFERIRRPKVKSVVNTSWAMGQIAHIKKGKRLRNLILKASPKNVMSKQMLKLYTLKGI